ncbi:hypothetical protein AAKU55_005728 [Oxalobacteraceae bacterium GrIS 1.11]
MTAAVALRALTISDGTLRDFATALSATAEKLMVATANALELLSMAGYAGMGGDTADDLRIALACHTHLLREFSVKVRTEERTTKFNTQSTTSYAAYRSAADQQGDTPCAITVLPVEKGASIEPGRAALTAAHRDLKVTAPLDDALKDGSLKVILRTVALRHMRRPPQTDVKRLAANDHD